MNPLSKFVPGLGQPISIDAMAAGQGIGLADVLGQYRQQQNTLAAAPTLGNPQAVQEQQSQNLAAMMEAHRAAQGQQAFGESMMAPEYIQNSGALGALAMIAQAAAGHKLRKDATETASDYASRIFAEEQRLTQEQVRQQREQADRDAASARARLVAQRQEEAASMGLDGAKAAEYIATGKVPKVPDGIATLEALAQRPDLAQVDRDRRRAGATNLSVSTGSYQRPFDTALAKADATAYADLRNRAAAAQQAMSSIDALDSILSNAQTGKMEEAMAIAGQFLGTEAGANFQATQALVNERVFELINSLKGPATDKDAERAQAQIPNMGTDARARQVVFDYLRKKAGQQVETFQDADAFLRERGNLQGWVPKYGAFSVDASPLQSSGGGGGAAQPDARGPVVRTWTPDGGVR